MPSTSTLSHLYERATTQRNVTIYTAILVGVPGAYAFQEAVGASGDGFLLLLLLAVGVPTAYDEHWPHYDRTWQAVAWVLVACLVVWIEYAALYLAGTTFTPLSSFQAGVAAFLVTSFGDFLLLSRLGA